jgi:hypothetical protein
VIDELVWELYQLGYPAAWLPQTGLVPPDIYDVASVASERRLVRRGALRDYLPAVARLPLHRGQMIDVDYHHTTHTGAVEFLARALGHLGISAIPKLDLGFTGGSELTISFAEVQFARVGISAVERMLPQMEPHAIPQDLIADGRLHIAYEYLYAGSVHVERADQKAFDVDVASRIGELVEVGSGARVSVEHGTRLVFSGSGERAAFACKAVRLTCSGSRWQLEPLSWKADGIDGFLSLASLPDLGARSIFSRAYADKGSWREEDEEDEDGEDEEDEDGEDARVGADVRSDFAPGSSNADTGMNSWRGSLGESLGKGIHDVPMGLPPGDDAQEDSGTCITRYPSIEATERADPSADIILLIDLERTPKEAMPLDPVAFDGLPAGWTEFSVTVRVASPQIAFADGNDEGTICVRRDQASVRCFLVGRRVRGVTGPLEVTATFFRRDRWCGTAQRTFAAGAPAPSCAVVLPSSMQAPDLTVHIHRTEGDRRRLVWLLAPAAAHRAHVRRACAESSLDDDPGAYVRGLFRAAAGIRPGAHASMMQGIGELLWERAPAAFHDAYWAMRNALGDTFSIQFITDEPYIPWELMRPVKGGEQTRLLAETHPVARGLLAYPDRLRPELPVDGEILTVAPDYTKRTQSVLPPLAGASEESAMLQARFRAIPIVPAFAHRIIDVLADRSDTPVRILHFAGHGQMETPIEHSHIACEDDDISIAQIRRQETRLGENHRTFVILNACAVGAAGDVLGEVGGWAEAFAYRNFSGFIAPLWAVFDDHAKLAMESFFEAILERGKPVGEALRDVRAAYGQYSPTFLSYVYYGDVHARFGW